MKSPKRKTHAEIDKARRRKKTNLTLSDEGRKGGELLMERTGLSLSQIVDQLIRKTAQNPPPPGGTL